ncbi:MAG TPA: M28 family peptidase [Telluria sp.]|nr:M28 family peptidase [Telluria sp.]
MFRLPVIALFAATHSLAFAAAQPLPADLQQMTAHIGADALRGHVSFLASDALEGRATPSRGLDVAAEYIASQFRRAGLKPAGDDGYFQTANWKYAERNNADFKMTIQAGGKSVSVPSELVSYQFKSGHALAATPVVRMDLAAAVAKPAAVNGKVLVMPMPAPQQAYGAAQQLAKAGAKPAAIVFTDSKRKTGNAGGKGWLVDPEAKPAAAPVPVITVHAPDGIALLDGAADASVSLSIPAGAERPVKLRNVIGVLPGSDPVLKDTYVILSAHYDHVGINNGEVFNGANDNASGTASVMEVANAMATLKQRPRRSVVFMAVWGEELGMVGSNYYGKHPVFPIAKTVANLNLEQMGRTDDQEGPQIDRAALTGFDFSDIGAILAKTGASMGIKIFKHEKFSDDFFGRSDNQALADQGIPAHTMSVAYAFSDYHGKDDTWDKIDYDNMARITRMVAVGVHALANDKVAPKWNEANKKTAPYVAAAAKLTAAAK